jgi:hypothetical protein
LWRVQEFFYETLRSVILGLSNLRALLGKAKKIAALLLDSQRKRKRQAAEASEVARRLAKG